MNRIIRNMIHEKVLKKTIFPPLKIMLNSPYKGDMGVMSVLALALSRSLYRSLALSLSLFLKRTDAAVEYGVIY
jgi:hypothetical protein